MGEINLEKPPTNRIFWEFVPKLVFSRIGRWYLINLIPYLLFWSHLILGKFSKSFPMRGGWCPRREGGSPIPKCKYQNISNKKSTVNCQKKPSTFGGKFSKNQVFYWKILWLTKEWHNLTEMVCVCTITFFRFFSTASYLNVLLKCLKFWLFVKGQKRTQFLSFFWHLPQSIIFVSKFSHSSLTMSYNVCH